MMRHPSSPVSVMRLRPLSSRIGVPPLTLGAASLIASAITAQPARGAALLWNNAAGGSAATAGNWSPVQVPVAADDLTFNLAATYSLSFSADVPTSNTHTYRSGTVTLSRSSPHTVTSGVFVGDLNGDSATLTLTTGSLTSNANSIIGDASGSIGTLNVNDDDADFIVGNGADLIVGNNGDATLNITAAGHVQVADQFIAGSNAASTPTVTVSGFSVAPVGASTLTVLGTGQSRIGAGGDAVMTISTGALADFAGDLVIANGSASTSSITVQTAGLLDARLVVDGDLLLARNVSAGIAAGDATVTVNAGGTVDVGDTIFVAGDDTAGTGDLNVNSGGDVLAGDIIVGAGGTLALNAGTVSVDDSLNIASPGVMSGTGTINGGVLNAGTITPSGVNGITFNGMVLQDGPTPIAGTKVHFGGTGGFQGSGAINAAIGGDNGALIAPTGALSLGVNTTSGFNYNGDLNVGANAVTIVDSNGAVFGAGGTTTILNGGSLGCAGGLGISNSAIVTGEGSLIGNVVCAGTLDPYENAVGGGLFAISGNLTMNPTGIVDIEIGGTPASGNTDRINVSGTATFNGTLRVRLKNGYTPQRGQQFITVNAVGGRSGTFASIEAPTDVCNGVTFVLVYSSTAAIVLIRPPDADTNDDGHINVTDLLAVISQWGPCGGSGEPDCGSANIDGVNDINVTDLLLVISNWGSCP